MALVMASVMASGDGGAMTLRPIERHEVVHGGVVGHSDVGPGKQGPLHSGQVARSGRVWRLLLFFHLFFAF